MAASSALVPTSTPIPSPTLSNLNHLPVAINLKSRVRSTAHGSPKLTGSKEIADVNEPTTETAYPNTTVAAARSSISSISSGDRRDIVDASHLLKNDNKKDTPPSLDPKHSQIILAPPSAVASVPGTTSRQLMLPQIANRRDTNADEWVEQFWKKAISEIDAEMPNPIAFRDLLGGEGSSEFLKANAAMQRNVEHLERSFWARLEARLDRTMIRVAESFKQQLDDGLKLYAYRECVLPVEHDKKDSSLRAMIRKEGSLAIERAKSEKLDALLKEERKLHEQKLSEVKQEMQKWEKEEEKFIATITEYRKYPFGGECELFLTSSLLRHGSHQDIKISSRAAYIRDREKLYYVDKLKNIWIQLDVSTAMLARFNDEMRPTIFPRRLTDQELKQITAITGHISSVESSAKNSRITNASQKKETASEKDVSKQLVSSLQTEVNPAFIFYEQTKEAQEIKKALEMYIPHLSRFSAEKTYEVGLIAMTSAYLLMNPENISAIKENGKDKKIDFSAVIRYQFQQYVKAILDCENKAVYEHFVAEFVNPQKEVVAKRGVLSKEEVDKIYTLWKKEDVDKYFQREMKSIESLMPQNFEAPQNIENFIQACQKRLHKHEEKQRRCEAQQIPSIDNAIIQKSNNIHRTDIRNIGFDHVLEKGTDRTLIYYVLKRLFTVLNEKKEAKRLNDVNRLPILSKQEKALREILLELRLHGGTCWVKDSKGVTPIDFALQAANEHKQSNLPELEKWEWLTWQDLHASFLTRFTFTGVAKIYVDALIEYTNEVSGQREPIFADILKHDRLPMVWVLLGFFCEHYQTMSDQKLIEAVDAIIEGKHEELKALKLSLRLGLLGWVRPPRLIKKLREASEKAEEYRVSRMPTELEKKDAEIRRVQAENAALRKQADDEKREKELAKAETRAALKEVEDLRRQLAAKNQTPSSTGAPSSPRFQFAGDAPASGNNNPPGPPNAKLR